MNNVGPVDEDWGGYGASGMCEGDTSCSQAKLQPPDSSQDKPEVSPHEYVHGDTD